MILRFWCNLLTCAATSAFLALATLANADVAGYQFAPLAGRPDGYSGFVDGTGSSASFTGAGSIVRDTSGNLFVADRDNHAVRMVSPSGVVSTFAGNGTHGCTDGTGRDARFGAPTALAFAPDGDLLVTDSDYHVIRRISPAGQVTTVAGIRNSSGYRDGATEQALFDSPEGIAVGADGTIYVADTGNNVIRRIGSNGIVDTLAGNTGQAGLADGSGSAARFANPRGLLILNGLILVADTGNHAIREVSASGAVRTYAGGNGSGFRDGAASTARFAEPIALADAGADGVLVVEQGVYDNGWRRFLRRISSSLIVDTPTQGRTGTTELDAMYIGMMAGAACAPDGALFITASQRIWTSPRHLFRPPEVTITPTKQELVPGSAWTLTAATNTSDPLSYTWSKDGASLYWGNVATARNDYATFGDTGLYRVTVTWAGGQVTSAPAEVSVKKAPTITQDPASKVFRWDETGEIVFTSSVVGAGPFRYQWRKKGQPIVGGTNPAYRLTVGQPSDAGDYDVVITNDFGTATSKPATLSFSQGPWISTQETTVTVSSGCLASVWATVRGAEPLAYQWYRNGNAIPSATAPALDLDPATPADSGIYMLVATNNEGSVRSEPISVTVAAANPTCTVSHLAGYVSGAGCADGVGTAARFNAPADIVRDASGNFFVADSANSVIRRIAPDGTVSLFAGLPEVRANRDGLGRAARFWTPQGLAFDAAGNLFVADPGTCTIRKITPAGEVTTVAGIPFNSASDDGPTSIAAIGAITGVAVRSDGTIIFTNPDLGLVRKVSPTRIVSTIAALPRATRLALDDNGDLVVTCDQTNTIHRVTQAGSVTLLAGTNGSLTSGDGQGPAARFASPGAIVRAPDGTFFIADGPAIRRMDAQTNVTTVAGTPAAPANFAGVTIDNNTLFIADHAKNTIYRLPLAGTATLFAGSGYGNDPFSDGQYRDGVGTAARFARPWGIAVGADNHIYVADNANNVVRKITPAGQVTTLAGKPGESGVADGQGEAARFSFLTDIAATPQGDVVVVDNGVLRRITPAGAVSTVPGITGITGIAAAGDGAILAVSNTRRVITRIAGDGSCSTLAGTGAYGNLDGPAAQATFKAPCDVTVSPTGEIFIADAFDCSIRLLSNGTVSTLFRDPSQTISPSHLCTTGSDGVYFTTQVCSVIYHVSRSGACTQLAGQRYLTGDRDGRGGQATFDGPAGLAIDNAGILYIADRYNCAIRKAVCTTSIPPTITTQPANVSAVAFAAASFSAQSSAEASVAYRWQRKPAGSDSWAYLSEGDGQTGVESPTLHITPVRKARDGDSYRCLVCSGNTLTASTAATLTMLKADQTITFPPLADRPFGSGPVTLSASASSALPVSFSLVTGDATLEGTALNFIAPGSITVRATQAGDEEFSQAVPIDCAFTITSDYTWWALQSFDSGNADDAALTAPEKVNGPDNATNLLKYALGVSPLAAIPTSQTVVRTDPSHLSLLFLRPADRSDVEYSVEASLDLRTWTTVDVELRRLAPADAVGIEQWEGRVSTDGKARFLRLKAKLR
jgi:sugar lactone lactonase YvrE